ncbi:hypothetical protein GGD45_006432, partial [Rhizobium tropici]|nr:hypothetical protein [Rhizobium tropici]
MSDYQMDDKSEVVEPSKPRIFEILGPGLVTGASDDDPSGIATYSQAGAQFGYIASWTLLLTCSRSSSCLRSICCLRPTITRRMRPRQSRLLH